MKDKMAAGLLALFLGTLGIHKFYLGRPVAGVLYLLFFWTMIPAILSIFDGIILLTMDDQRFNDIYNGGKKSTIGLSQAGELEKLHSLMEKGIITEAEFKESKDRLL